MVNIDAKLKNLTISVKYISDKNRDLFDNETIIIVL